ILEVGATARPAELLAAGIFQNRVDLDDVGAPVRQLPDAGWAGPHPCEVEHGEAGQGLRSSGECHLREAPDKYGYSTVLIDQNERKFNSRSKGCGLPGTQARRSTPDPPPRNVRIWHVVVVVRNGPLPSVRNRRRTQLPD